VKIRACFLCFILTLLMLLSSVGTCSSATSVLSKQLSEGENKYAQDICFLFIEPALNEALADFYDKPVLYSRQNVTIESIDRPDGAGTYNFIS
jgi:hypothetical protein